MVDSINTTSAVGSLLRAQLSSSVSGLKANQQNAQALVQQLQKTAAPAKSTGVTLTSNTKGRSGNLPRGSLVDKLV
jgi:hypothetical protein